MGPRPSSKKVNYLSESGHWQVDRKAEESSNIVLEIRLELRKINDVLWNPKKNLAHSMVRHLVQGSVCIHLMSFRPVGHVAFYNFLDLAAMFLESIWGKGVHENLPLFFMKLENQNIFHYHCPDLV